jgi:hypothetical protein
MDLRPLLLIVFVAALLRVTHRAVTDWIGGLVVGWFAVIARGTADGIDYDGGHQVSCRLADGRTVADPGFVWGLPFECRV